MISVMMVRMCVGAVVVDGCASFAIVAVGYKP